MAGEKSLNAMHMTLFYNSVFNILHTSLYQGVVVTSTGQHKHLMLLISGSTRNFDSTWNLYSYNDPTNNKSDWDIFDLINGGEYKAHIDPSWGDPEWVRYFNP